MRFYWLLVATIAIGCTGTITEPGAGGDPGDPDASGGDDDDQPPGPPDAAVTYDAPPVGPNPAAPRLIAGGGVADAPIGGKLNVYVIDQRTGAAIAGASVRVGSATGTTDATGLYVLDDAALAGRQTVTATATGHVPATWIGVAGANVTVPLTPTAAPAIATVSGTISGWDSLPAPAGFNQYNLALVLYTFLDDLNAPENSIPAPMDGTTPANTCLRTALANNCAWKMNARVGKQLHYAVIVRGDTKNTPSDTSDDTYTLLGYAVGSTTTLSAGQNVSNESLTMVPAGAQTGLAVSFGGAPSGLGKVTAIPMIHLGDVGRVMLPLPVISPAASNATIPSAQGAFAGGKTEVLTIASPPSASAPFSIACARAVSGGSASPGNYPTPPAALSASGSTISFTRVQGASLHFVVVNGADARPRWNLVVLDDTASFTLPPLAPDPLPSGTLTLLVTGTFVPAFAQSAFDLPTVTSIYTHAAGAQATFQH